MKKFLFLIFFSSFLFSEETIEKLLEEMQKTQEKIETIKADFNQKKVSKVFSTPQYLKGIIYFKKPDFIRWEYQEPEPFITFVEKEEFKVYYPSLKKLKLGKIGRLRGRVFSILFAQEPLQKLKNHFIIELRKKREEDILILIPQTFKLKKYWTKWVLVVDKSNFLPKSIEVYEKDGDFTLVEFKNIKINVPLEEEIFKFTPPPDITIENYSKTYKY